MKKIFLLPALILFLLVGCKKDIAPSPAASFTFRNDTTSVFKIPTYDTCTFTSTSVNADSVIWDLGNGTTLKGDRVVASYPVPGTYIVKLTATGKDGKQSISSKKVIVLDRVLKKIIIKNVFWDTIPGNIDHYNYIWPQSSKANVFVRLQKYSPGDSIVPYGGILPNSPILYSSPEVPDVSYRSNTRYEINVPGKVIIDKKLVLNRTLALSLMAKDANGVVYNLVSSLASGSSFGLQKDDFPGNIFTIVCSIYSSIELQGDFEE